jgi:hypothetical protein
VKYLESLKQKSLHKPQSSQKAKEFFYNFVSFLLGRLALSNTIWLRWKWLPDRLKVIFIREMVHSVVAVRCQNSREALDLASAKRSLRFMIGIAKKKLHFKVHCAITSPRVASQEAPRSIALISDSDDFTTGIRNYLSNDLKIPLVILNLCLLKANDPNFTFSRSLLNVKDKRLEVISLLEKAANWKSVNAADVWIIDWCTENAVIFSQLKPPEKRLFIRIHRYDAFSWYAYLVDWSKIDGLIFVSNTIRDIFLDLHSAKINNIKVVVARNGPIGTFRIKQSKSKVLGLLQYHSETKDPLFALSLLKYFLARDPSWKLVLAGPAFEQKLFSELEERVHSYILENGLAHAVEIQGYQNHVDKWFPEIGYILSSSQSEGSHESLREGILHGCVPLIRNWPAIKEYGGAYGAYPELSDFIFDSVEDGFEIAKRWTDTDQVLIIEEHGLMRIDNLQRLFN